MTDAPRVVTRALLVRAGIRALVGAGAGGLLGAGHGGVGALVLALHGGAAWGATALVERAVATRAQARSALVAGLAAAVGCGAVHAATILDAALWLQAPGLDLGGRLAAIAAWVDDLGARDGPGPVFYLVCLAWLLAGASGPAAVAELRRLQGRPLMVPLERTDERWVAPLEAWCAAFALWVAPVMTVHMDGVGPSLGDRVAPFGAVVLVSGMASLTAGAIVLSVLWGLDLLSARLALDP